MRRIAIAGLLLVTAFFAGTIAWMVLAVSAVLPR